MKELKQYLEAGLSALPASRARKCPTIPSWKQFQNRLPSVAEEEAWDAAHPEAICIVCGKVSGNLEVIDFDNHGELFPAWLKPLPQELYDRLVIEQSPSGGYHVAYRCEEPVCGNMKLAVGKRGGKDTTLIETRGEGGLILCAPSPGYVLRRNSWTDLPLITAEERVVLLQAAYDLDEQEHETGPEQNATEFYSAGLRPGDDYNERGDIRALLVSHGWTYLRRTPDGNEHWRRPGKTEDGTSATLKDNSFYVFSSNAAPFEPGKSYSPFTVYALLEHNGDYSRAASALIEDGYGQQETVCDIDLSGILAQARHEEETAPEQPSGNLAGLSGQEVHTADPELAKPKGGKEPAAVTKKMPEKKNGWVNEYSDNGQIPDHLLHIPGFIDEFVAWSMSSAPYPNSVLEFCGALAFLSYAVGRKVISDRNTLPNLYMIALANSGTGKDHPRKVNMQMATSCAIGGGVCEDITSGAALEDTLLLHNSILFQKDEIDTLFNVIKMAKDPNAEGMLGKLLSVYGSSNSSIPVRNKAISRMQLLKMQKEAQNGGNGLQSIVNYPYLTIFGTAIPKFFYESLTPRILSNGMAARCIMLNAGQRGEPNRSKRIEPTESILKKVEVMRNYSGPNPKALPPNMLEMHATPEANAMLDEISLKYDRKYHSYDDVKEQIPWSFWARASEKVIKLSMLYGISADVAAPVITPDAVRWADEFVDFTTRQALFLAGTFSYENPFDEKKLKLLRYIRERGGIYPHAELLKRSHESKEVFGKLIDTLIEAEEITFEMKDVSGKRPQKFYVLRK